MYFKRGFIFIAYLFSFITLSNAQYKTEPPGADTQMGKETP